MNKMLKDMIVAGIADNNGSVTYDKEAFDKFTEILNGFAEVTQWFKTSRYYGFQENEDGSVTYFKKQLNSSQRTALMIIADAVQFEVGGWENAVMDGYMEELPAIEDMMENVYHEITGNYNTQQLNFLTTKWLKAEITREIKKETGMA